MAYTFFFFKWPHWFLTPSEVKKLVYTYRHRFFPGSPYDGGTDNGQGEVRALLDQQVFRQVLGVGVCVWFVTYQLGCDWSDHVIIHPSANRSKRQFKITSESLLSIFFTRLAVIKKHGIEDKNILFNLKCKPIYLQL